MQTFSQCFEPLYETRALLSTADPATSLRATPRANVADYSAIRTSSGVGRILFDDVLIGGAISDIQGGVASRRHTRLLVTKLRPDHASLRSSASPSDADHHPVCQDRDQNTSRESVCKRELSGTRRSRAWDRGLSLIAPSISTSGRENACSPPDVLIAEQSATIGGGWHGQQRSGWP